MLQGIGKETVEKENQPLRPYPVWKVVIDNFNDNVKNVIAGEVVVNIFDFINKIKNVSEGIEKEKEDGSRPVRFQVGILEIS